MAVGSTTTRAGEAALERLRQWPGEHRVAVGLSGGVDSSVTAAMLHEQGYEVIGITLQLYDHGVAIQAKGACCAGADIHDALSLIHI